MLVPEGGAIAGDIAVIGPALSSLDAQLSYQDPRNATKAKEARSNASHYAAAQEARNMLGKSTRHDHICASRREQAQQQ